MSDLLRYLALAALCLYGLGCGHTRYNVVTHDLETHTLLKDISAKVTLPDGTSIDLTSNTDEAALKAVAEGAASGAVKGMRP